MIFGYKHEHSGKNRFIREMDEHMNIRKDSIAFDKTKQHLAKMNKNKRKERIISNKVSQGKSKIIEINKHLSIITINMNSLHSLIERCRLADWIKNKIQLFVVYNRHALLEKEEK
jgi:hypothetical protein